MSADVMRTTGDLPFRTCHLPLGVPAVVAHWASRADAALVVDADEAIMGCIYSTGCLRYQLDCWYLQ